MKSSVSVEDFLKSIYLIKKDEGQKVTCSLLAKQLKISNPAVTDMARKLSRKGLIRYEKYKELRLSVAGKKIALNMVRRHRLWETFLHRVLQLDLQSIHKEAEHLEHESSEFLINRIAEFLGEPLYDPHGDPIPDSEGVLPGIGDVIRLSEAKVGDSGFIVRLKFSKPEYTMFYDKYSLNIGSPIKVISKDDRDGTYELNSENQYFFAGKNMVNQIFLTLNNYGDNII